MDAQEPKKVAKKADPAGKVTKPKTASEGAATKKTTKVVKRVVKKKVVAGATKAATSATKTATGSTKTAAGTTKTTTGATKTPGGGTSTKGTVGAKKTTTTKKGATTTTAGSKPTKVVKKVVKRVVKKAAAPKSTTITTTGTPTTKTTKKTTTKTVPKTTTKKTVTKKAAPKAKPAATKSVPVDEIPVEEEYHDFEAVLLDDKPKGGYSTGSGSSLDDSFYDEETYYDEETLNASAQSFDEITIPDNDKGQWIEGTELVDTKSSKNQTTPAARDTPPVVSPPQKVSIPQTMTFIEKPFDKVKEMIDPFYDPVVKSNNETEGDLNPTVPWDTPRTLREYNKKHGRKLHTIKVFKETQFSRVGMTVAAIGGYLFVLKINQTGLLADTTLQVGDIIVSINEFSFRKFPNAKHAYEAIRNAVGDIHIVARKSELSGEDGFFGK